MSAFTWINYFLSTYIAEFYRFLHNSCAWFYNIDFLSRLLRLKVSYISFSFIIFSDMVRFMKNHFSCFKFRLLWQKCLRRKPCHSCKGQIKAAAFFWTDKTAHGMKALIFCQKHEKNGIFRKIISEKARCQSSRKVKVE